MMSNFNQQSQTVSTQYNADIIQNIYIVGQFLKSIELGKISLDSSNIPHVNRVLENFPGGVNSDLTKSVAFAGEVLSGVVDLWERKSKDKILPYREILTLSPKIIYNKLVRLNYWKLFCTPLQHVWRGTPGHGEMTELVSLNLLWEKKFDKEDFRLFAGKFNRYGKNHRHYVFLNGGGYEIANKISIQEFPYFMTGLLLDLIRLNSVVLGTKDYWKDFVDSLSIQSQENQ